MYMLCDMDKYILEMAMPFLGPMMIYHRLEHNKKLFVKKIAGFAYFP